MIRTTYLFLILIVLIFISYLLNLVSFLNSLAIVIMLIPQHLIIIPLAGLEMPLRNLIESEILSFDFLPFFISILYIFLLLILNVSLYYISRKRVRK